MMKPDSVSRKKAKFQPTITKHFTPHPCACKKPLKFPEIKCDVICENKYGQRIAVAGSAQPKPRPKTPLRNPQKGDGLQIQPPRRCLCPKPTTVLKKPTVACHPPNSPNSSPVRAEGPANVVIDKIATNIKNIYQNNDRRLSLTDIKCVTPQISQANYSFAKAYLNDMKTQPSAQQKQAQQQKVQIPQAKPQAQQPKQQTQQLKQLVQQPKQLAQHQQVKKCTNVVPATPSCKDPRSNIYKNYAERLKHEIISSKGQSGADSRLLINALRREIIAYRTLCMQNNQNNSAKAYTSRWTEPPQLVQCNKSVICASECAKPVEDGERIYVDAKAITSKLRFTLFFYIWN